MSVGKLIKFIKPSSRFLSSVKNTSKPISNIINELDDFISSGKFLKKTSSLFESKPQKPEFLKWFERNFSSFDEINDKKLNLLESLSSRRGLSIKDIGSISRYDDETIKFISELKDDELLKIKDFLGMKDRRFPLLQTVDSETIKQLVTLNQNQLDFIKKYIQLENRGFRVFSNEQVLTLAQKGISEQKLNKLVFEGNLRGESILEASFIKNLDTDKLINEIKNAKKLYGKNFGDAYVFHNNYNLEDFTLAIFNKSTGKVHLKTFDKNFNVINTEEIFANGFIVNGNFMTRNSLLNSENKKQLLQMIERDKNTILQLSRNSQKTGINTSLTLNANWTERKTFDKLLHSAETVKEEVSFIGKNGEQLVETMVPSEITGIYKIIQKAPDGTVKILSDAKIDPQTGIRTITKNFESLNGTKTNKILQIQPDGSRTMCYRITNSDGKVLMDRKLSHTFTDVDGAVSIINDRKYEIKYTADKIFITNAQNGKLTEIDLIEILQECNPLQRKELMQAIRQMHAEDLLYLQDKVKNFEFIDDVTKSSACFGGENIGHIKTGNNHFVLTHELYHLISESPNVRNISKQKFNYPKNIAFKIESTYKKEWEAFLKKFPEAQRKHIEYFTQQVDSRRSLEETIAESGGILSNYNNMPFSMRTEYLERYFPETIAQIETASVYEHVKKSNITDLLASIQKRKLPY